MIEELLLDPPQGDGDDDGSTTPVPDTEEDTEGTEGIEDDEDEEVV